MQSLEKATFPPTHIDWRELIWFRSWQGEGLLKIYYYVGLVAAVIHYITSLIVYTVQYHAGGFFFGLIGGFLVLLFSSLVMRVYTEYTMSIFRIRDSAVGMENKGSQSHVHTQASRPFEEPKEFISEDEQSYQSL